MIATRTSPLAVAVIMVAGGLGAAAAAAQMSIAPPPPPPEPSTAPAGAVGRGGRTVVEMPAAPATTRASLSTFPSAQSVLQDLLRDTSPLPAGTGGTTLPGGETTGAAGATQAALEMRDGLLREGATISGRTGHLVKVEGGKFQFAFDATGKIPLPPMGIIPSRRLTALEEASDGGTKPVKFTIDAEVTQYRGRNYLYVQDSEALTPVTPPATAPVPTTLRATPVVDAVAPNEPEAIRVRERETIYYRVGRLVKDEKSNALVFVFDSDGRQMSDPPMGLVPSRYLQVMEDASENGTKPLKFRISAKITQYRGKNFLYLQFVQAVRDLNQGLGG